MSPRQLSVICILAYLVLMLFVVLMGCAVKHTEKLPTDGTCIHGQQGDTCYGPLMGLPQSWDQANLKKNDTADCQRGNPVFVAPNGTELTQCL